MLENTYSTKSYAEIENSAGFTGYRGSIGPEKEQYDEDYCIVLTELIRFFQDSDHAYKISCKDKNVLNNNLALNYKRVSEAEEALKRLRDKKYHKS
jgi:hypothetical protein